MAVADRLSFDRALSVGRGPANPYLRLEAFDDSRFAALSRTGTMAGASFPFTRYWELEAYFDYQFDTGNSPKRRAIGAVSTFDF